jgi:hypothetical protein
LSANGFFSKIKRQQPIKLMMEITNRSIACGVALIIKYDMPVQPKNNEIAKILNRGYNSVQHNI